MDGIKDVSKITGVSFWQAIITPKTNINQIEPILFMLLQSFKV
ncbi:hypothetical protein MARINOS108_90083 [Marinoscillum sp. 108]|nr:hypothetical protein MARINOS108_90083 [Marinoscillum sp. 108]